MDARQARIYDEAAALWRALYDDQPPELDGSLLLEMITQGLNATEYHRIRSPYLRASTIVGPGCDGVDL